jgi:phosphohistidine phosphatase
LDDIQRPLNERGLRTAPLMGEYILKHHEIANFAIISSPARRALETARIFAEKLNYDSSEIIISNQIYSGGCTEYLDALSELSESFTCALFFGHNPIIEELVGLFDNSYRGLAPTCSVFYIQIKGNSWKHLSYQHFKIVNAYLPKNVLR